MYEEVIKQLWPEWNVDGIVGEGTYGIVYAISLTDEVRTTRSLVKLIPFPRTDVEMTSMMTRFSSDDAVRLYFKNALDVYKAKMKMLEPFRLNPALVRVDEYRIQERHDMPGWFLAIRMAPSTSLSDSLKGTNLSEKQVIQMGIDICKAIEILASCGVVHGNIKPENIFVSKDGRYKLGDHVINQMMDQVKVSLSKKKTPSFLAPEVYKENAYDTTADIYSLGLVMYRCMNKGRLPFMDLEAQTMTFAQKRAAMDQRFNGEELPAPVEASEALGHIIRKACQFDADKRYQSATELKEKLEALQNGTYKMLEDPIGLASNGRHDTIKSGEDASKENVAKVAAALDTTTKEDTIRAVRESAAAKSKTKVQTDSFSLIMLAAGFVVILLIVTLTLVSRNRVEHMKTTEETTIQETEEITDATESLEDETETAEAVTDTETGTDEVADDTQATMVVTTTATEIKLTELTTQYQCASLDSIYSNRWKMGVAASVTDVKNEARASLIVHEFNSITAENATKPDAVLDANANKQNPDLYNTNPKLDFSEVDYYLAFAQANDMQLRWHTFVWHQQTPDWFFYEDYDTTKSLASREVMLARMESYIKQVFEHCETYYPGVVYCADVANEVFEDGGGSMRNSLWYQTVGEDYVEYAFQYARKYAPSDCKLFLNDFNEYIPSKMNAIYNLADQLNKKGLIDGIGLQSHLDVSYPSISQYETMLTKLGSLGLELQVTELDVTISDNSAESLSKQKDYYQELFRVLIQADKNETADITAVTIWGLTDDQSWRSEKYPLLFDSNLEPKDAFDSVIMAGSMF